MAALPAHRHVDPMVDPAPRSRGRGAHMQFRWPGPCCWLTGAAGRGGRVQERADRTEWSRGCRPTFSNSSRGPDEVKFMALPHTDFWGFDLNNSEFLSLDACQAQCTGEPSCVVFQYKQGKGECYPKSLMFNGRTFPGLPGTAYLKLPADLDVPEVHVHQWRTEGLAI